MIILDTNVVSEPMRPHGDPAVIAWLDRQVAATLYLTSINLAELLVGVDLLPKGKRKTGWGAALDQLLAQLFESRILPFDDAAARAYAPLLGRARGKGHSVGAADGQIAAIATVHGFTVATRDTAPFEAAGVAVVNPWKN